jgi:glyoxylase-like metal-dependent hydrolase (beta-lactamase superfamily II)
MSRRILRVAAGAVAGLVLAGATAFAQSAPVRSIDPIAGDVYTFRNAGHYGIFAVTADGVILVDPISVDAATWLKEQLATRFPGKVVKTIVYSHHDGDHSGGAEVFKETVTEIVAHENAPAGILADDRVSVMPTRTFTGRTEVRLGGRTIELVELGPGHTDNLVGIRFPEERLLFVVDIFSGKRLPYNGMAGETAIDTIIGTLRRIETMDFTLLATGHSGRSSLVELVGYRTFLENLRAEVLQARRENKSVADMVATITMPGYRDFGNYGIWLKPSIENMNAYLERIGAR